MALKTNIGGGGGGGAAAAGGGDLSAIGYYDKFGNFWEYEKKVENKHTKTGVLLRNDIPDPDEPENPEIFVSEWKEQVTYTQLIVV